MSEPHHDDDPAPPPLGLAWGLLALGWAAGLLEAQVLAERLDWGRSLSGGERTVFTLAVSTKTLAMLLPALALTWGAHALGRPRLARAGGAALGALTLGLAVLDTRVAAVTGNRLTDYLPYLDDRQPLEWAGAQAGSLFGSLALVALGVAATAGVALGLAARWAGPRRTGPRTFAATLAAALVVPPALACLQRSVEVERLDLALGPSPLRLAPLDLAPDEAFQAALSVEFDRLYAPVEAAARACAHPQPQLAPPADPPDLVVIALESLRAASFDDPAVTPRIARWADAHATRGAPHHANANCSYLGVFSLLYGRSPLLYDATIDREEPAVLCDVLAAAGYETALFSSSHFQWERMDSYLGERNFRRVTIEAEGPWPDRDRAVLAALRQRLDEPDRPPLFALVFLMSTHFDYAYPAGYQRRTPDDPPLDWIALRRAGPPSPDERARWENRYANTLGFVDDALGELLEGLDLTRTGVVVTGDHGESFYEDGAWLHSSRISDAQTAVPLLAAGPLGAAAWAGPTSHLDLAPTLLHAALGTTWPTPHLHGRDLLAPDPGPAVFVVAGENEDYALFAPEGRLRLAQRRGRLRPLGLIDRDDGYQPAPADPEPWRRRVVGWLGRLRCP